MSYDTIIIGAGSIGMAAGYYLTKKNNRVVLIDAYDPPHSEGSHHGDTRIIRHAYGEGESYVPLALRAQELWIELQKKSNKELFLQTGVLNIGTSDSLFIKNVINSANEYALPIEKLTAQEINNRWEGFHIPDDLVGCFEKKSGVLMSENCIRAYRDLANRNGATLLTNTIINRINIKDNEIIIDTNREAIKGKKLIVAAGKGTNEVLSMIDVKLPLQATRKTFSWLNVDESIYKQSVFPAWVYDAYDKTYYGFPSIHHTGIKIGRHDGGLPTNPTKKLAPFGTFPEDEDDISYITNQLFSKRTTHKEGKVCTYTNTPDGDFIIDTLPNHPNILVACGFSGHGFKFSSAIGELLSEYVVEGHTSIDISSFSLNRFH